jgi:aquaporin NIP
MPEIEVVEKEEMTPPRDVPLWKSLTAEMIGTFFLVFIGAGAAALTFQQGGSIVGTAFAFGLVLMVLIYLFGEYSGANFNPAVSLGLAISGRMDWSVMVAYWIVQFIAGIAAAALIMYFLPGSNDGASIGTLTDTDQWKAVIVEMFATFFLVISVLIITKNKCMSPTYGAAIGLVLAFDIMAIGYLTGGSMNPARSFGPAIFSNNLDTFWIYLLGPLLGALLAAVVYRLYTYNFGCCYKVDECGNQVYDECGNPIKICNVPEYDKCGNIIC